MLLAVSLTHVASAASLETLLMPGKVSNAHAKLEAGCSNCHDRTNKVTQTSLCLSCHKDVAVDVQKHSGFHGKMPNAATVQCQGCHTEHIGRDGDIVKIVPEQFDHQRTDFALRDAHVTVACASCHQTGKKYREAQSTCVACHKKDEPHSGQLGADCAACHGSLAWLNARYDHSKTRFSLANKHAEVQCSACHAGNRYKNTPMQCVSCHAPDDVHRTTRGTTCDQCHSTISWTTAKFDHARETGFALSGAHARTDCVSCHTTGRMNDPIPKDCSGCHKAQDSHAGRMGDKCDQCHNSTDWKTSTFDHARDTEFALTGPHAKLNCDTCHTANIATQKLGTTCIGCHRAQDAHAGKLGEQCDQCHVANTWRGEIRFDHDLTDFPLVGLHVAVPCEQCHLTQQFKDVKTDCSSCHASDDVHRGGLGKNCASCHNSNGWNIWTFDHGKATRFALTGAHAKLDCAGCHKQPASEVKLSRDCGSCHVRDDVHFGQFGRQCQRCHTTISFKQVRMQ
jgi:Cytochrome c3/Cytochrome c7 and related cytochrome c